MGIERNLQTLLPYRQVQASFGIDVFQDQFVIQELSECGVKFVGDGFLDETFNFDGDAFDATFGGENVLGGQVNFVVHTTITDFVRIGGDLPTVFFQGRPERSVVQVSSHK
jgi:hypothetical protein